MAVGQKKTTTRKTPGKAPAKGTGAARKRQSRVPSDKPNLILDAAGSVFRAAGYSAATVDEIARVANVSKATIYAHFGGKEALFAAVVQRAGQRSGLASVSEIDPSVPIRDALVDIGTRLGALILDPNAVAVYRMVVAETPRQPALGRLFYEIGPERSHAALARFLTDRAKRGDLRLDDPAEAAGHFFSLMRGVQHLCQLFSVGTRPTKAAIAANVERGVDVFLAYYGAKRR